MNVPSMKGILEKGSFPVNMVMNAQIKGKVVRIGGSAFAEIVQGPQSGCTEEEAMIDDLKTLCRVLDFEERLVQDGHTASC